MDFDFSPEQYTLRDEARRFLDAQCTSAHVREHIDDPAAWSRALWKQMADLGWMGLAIPERHGGLGMSFQDQVLLLGELGRACAPVPYLSSAVFFTQALLRHGSEEQQARFLPGIATGERVGAMALVGPDGADGSGVTATRDGDGWRLSGEKVSVLDAPAADVLVVAVDGSWYVVEDGFTVEAKRAFDRTRPIGAVRFDGAPAEPLASAGTGAALRIATAAVCAEMVGVAAKILDMSVEYSKQREQFGRPIGSFQAIKHKAAEMLADLEPARAAAFYACWAADTGAEDADVAVSVAKSFCSEALARVGGEGVQIHGGIAFTWEHDMHLYLRRIKSDEALLGDAGDHRERLARLVGL